MKTLSFILFLFFSATTFAQSCDSSLVTKFFEQRSREWIQEGEYKSLRQPYRPKPNTKINLPLLSNLLPNFCFCRTKVPCDPHYTAEGVTTIVALNLLNYKESQFVTVDGLGFPGYDSFIPILKGMRVKDSSERKVLVDEVMQLLSYVSLDKRSIPFSNKRNTRIISIGRTFNDERYGMPYIFDFYFDEHNVLYDIKLEEARGYNKFNYIREE